MEQLSRRAFLLGRVTRKSPPLRPPWSVVEPDFLKACTRCGDCVAVCPNKIVVVGDGGFPQIDFSLGVCSFCRKCVDVCKPLALQGDASASAWTYRASIGENCLAKQGVVCRTCGEACEPQAIRFSPQIGSAALPLLQPDACSGCGACVALCPSHAIAVSPA